MITTVDGYHYTEHLLALILQCCILEVRQIIWSTGDTGPKNQYPWGLCPFESQSLKST